MQVFLSWSGDRSKAAANAFHTWIPDVLQNVQTWMSSEDICSGAGWNEQIRRALDASNFGIIFVTRDNQESVWLMFEAGALAKHVDNTHVVPLIVDDDVTPAMLTGPLGQLQAVEANRAKILRLMRDLNYATKTPLPDTRFERCFNTHWPSIEIKLKELPSPIGPKPELDPNNMLAQILTILRQDSRNGESAKDAMFSKWGLGRRRLQIRIKERGWDEATIEEIYALYDSISDGELWVRFADKAGKEYRIFPSGEIQEIDEF